MDDQARSGPASEFSHLLARSLTEAKEIHLATRRRDGSKSRAAPVWFWFDGHLVYFTVGPESYKARRLLRGSPVFGWVGRPAAMEFEGDCARVTDLSLVEEVGRMYREKYWIAWLGLFRPRPSRVAAGKTLMFRFAPRAASGTEELSARE